MAHRSHLTREYEFKSLKNQHPSMFNLLEFGDNEVLRNGNFFHLLSPFEIVPFPIDEN